MDEQSTTDERLRALLDDDRTRRAFLGTTASLGTLTIAGCVGEEDDGGAGGPATTSANGTQESDDGGTRTATTTTTTTTGSDDESDDSGDQSADPAPDVPVLNFALTLEHLENAFYRDGLDEFSEDELMAADVLSEFGDRIRMEVPGYLETVGAHEAGHVDALGQTIEALDGTPVEEGEYDFGYETPSEFFRVAAALENTGVAAYAGAAPRVVDNDVLSAAAGIHSVEARHAGFLNLVNGVSPFPNEFDPAATLEEVLDVAGGFITSEVDPSVFERGESPPQQDRKAGDDTSDVEVLNFALTLEHLEATFYQEGLDEFTDDEICGADVLSEFGSEFVTSVPGYLATVCAHEVAHVEAIADTVEALGGDPVEEAEYDFGYETPSEFLGVAAALENVGVSAYAGAVPTVTNDDVLDAGLAIHSVEARHASVFNEINGTSPFPDAVDEPRTIEEVLEIAGQFIVDDD